MYPRKALKLPTDAVASRLGVNSVGETSDELGTTEGDVLAATPDFVRDLAALPDTGLDISIAGATAVTPLRKSKLSSEYDVRWANAGIADSKSAATTRGRFFMAIQLIFAGMRTAVSRAANGYYQNR